MRERVKEILRAHARLSVDVGMLDDDADLYQAGFTSHACVEVMLAVEDAFDVEFPEEMLRKGTFQSVAAICTAVEALAAVGGRA